MWRVRRNKGKRGRRGLRRKERYTSDIITYSAIDVCRWYRNNLMSEKEELRRKIKQLKYKLEKEENLQRQLRLES